jgi:hypothetical protein
MGDFMKNIHIHFDFTFPLILTIIFIILKGLNIINWVWYWLISPLWIMFIVMTLTFIILKIKGWL